MADFSKPSVEKAVFKDTITHPASVYPASITILGGIGFALFQSPIALAAAGAGLAVGIGGWLFNHYYRRDYFSRKYMEQLHAQLRQETIRRLESLELDLKNSGCILGVRQLPRLGAKFQNFTEILESKLDKTEMTYGRYLGLAEQVYLGALDNLQEVASMTKSLSSMDADYIHVRLKELARDKSSDAREEEATLHERLDLLKKTQDDIQDLISDNESAMTSLDKTTTELARIKTRKGQANVDLEVAMKELEIMASRAQLYDNRRRGKDHGRIEIEE